MAPLMVPEMVSDMVPDMVPKVVQIMNLGYQTDEICVLIVNFFKIATIQIVEWHWDLIDVSIEDFVSLKIDIN